MQNVRISCTLISVWGLVVAVSWGSDAGRFLIEFNNLVAGSEHLNCCWLLASPKVQFDYAMLLQRDAGADQGENGSE